MQNIDVRFNASSNFGKVKADLAALQAQAASLGAVFAQNAFARPPALVDPSAWQRSTRAVHEASNAYRNAVSSSGILTSQQIRATSEAERYTKALQKQKLTMGEMRRHHGIMKQVYADQLRYQRMTAQYWGTDSAGRAITDITIPKNVPRDLDTVAQKIYFTGQMAKSAGTQIVNMGKNMQWAGRQLTVGFTYPVALFGAAAGVMAYKVDEAMTGITKVYDVSAKSMQNEAARAEELNRVRVRSMEIAKQAANDYGMAVENTLGIEQQLASTGLRGEKLFGSTAEVSRIATLGDIDTTQATDMTIALQTAFKDTIKTTKDLTNTFNYMNAVENATSLTLQDIAEATPRAASAMAALGVSAQEMTVLLVAMREAGVDAAEGANALKSATGTILSPSPAAVDFVKEIAGGRVAQGVKNIAQTSGGNLYTAMEQLHALMKDLNNTQQQQVLVKLFGKYQFNRVSAMLDNLGAAWDGTQNQARRSMDLMNEDMRTLGDNAQKEIDEKMNSLSGRFKRAWESLRGELAELGVPFLEIATKVLEGASKLAALFNGMDDWKKKAALVVAAVMAIAGPVVMLGGLFMNLAGQFITGSGRIMSGIGRLGGAFGLLNKEEQAATLSAEAQNRAMMQQQSTTSTLAAEVNVLTAAYEKATAAARAYAETQGVATATQTRASGATAATATTIAAGTVTSGNNTGRAVSTNQLPSGTNFLGMPGGSAASAFIAPVQQTAAAYGQAADRAQMLARTERERLHDQTRNNRAALAEQRIRENIEGRVNGASLGMASMGLAMGAMMVTNNSFVNSLAKWLLIATIVVPAVKVMATTIGVAAKSAWSQAAAQIAAAKAARANAAATAATAGRFGALRAGVGGLASGIAGVLGPGGVLTLGVLAVGGAYYWAWNKGKEAREAAAEAYREQVRLANEVESSTRKWAEQMGIVVGKYERVAEVSKLVAGKDAADQQQQLIDYYKTNPEGEEGAPIDPFKDMDTESVSFQLQMTQKFIDLQAEARLSAEDAASHMRAFYIALGMSADEADAKAQLLLQTWGNIKGKDFDWAGYLEQQMTLFNNSDAAGMEAAGKNVSEAFWAGMANAPTPDAAQALVDQFTTTSQQNISDVWAELGNTYGREWYSMMEDQGVHNAKQFAEFLRSTTMEELANLEWENTDKMGTTIVPGVGEVEKPDGYSLPWGSIEMVLEDANREQDRLLSGLNEIVKFGDDVASVFDLGSYYKVDALTSSYDEAKNTIEDMAAANAPRLAQMSQEERIMQTNIINAYNLANGLKQGGTYTEALANFMNRVSAEAGNAADEADKVKKNVESIRDKTVTIRIKQVGGIIQTAMANVQGRMADSAMNQFNASWDAQMDKAQDTWDNRTANLEADHEAAMNRLERGQEAAQQAFDNRWEARREAIEKAYQKRIDRVNREIESEQKADEIRQRLFENERRRLEALADAENTDIDFNTALNEGRLDDAAKIANNAGVDSANAQMEAEQAAAEARTAARIKALEKKNERLEKARDRELENLQKLEERMRKHLERVQEARRQALEQQQADEVAALERSEEADMRSMEKRRDYEEAMLEQRLELFKSYTARNQKDLERWMNEVGLSYDDFGKDVKAKGEDWSKHFRTELATQIRQAGTEIMNDNIWENVGKGIANKLLSGLGFENLAQFNRFVKTGSKGGGEGGQGGETETRHEGGMIGTGGGSRGNIPNTYKGLHRSEKMVRAQKGEYMINRDATRKNLGLLEAINKGADIPMPGEGGIGNPGYGGPVGMLSGAIAQMFKQGMEKSFQNNYEIGMAKKRARQAQAGSYKGEAGTYGGRQFSAAQMKNAAIIASVGSSMGMSNRDIMIGIMTAIAESGLVNVNYGDRDSLGLFQQRPSMGWGTPAQLTDPEYAARAFFGPLRAHGERNDETPWLAAQHIQRSAFADGSNYRVWWDAAQSIFKSGLDRRSGGAGGGYVPGKGGKTRPIRYAVSSGLHGGSTAGNPPAVDLAGPTGAPVYAVASGRITSSRDIAGPLASDSYRGDGPYGSFGRMITLQTDGGAHVLYAHLSRRSVSTGQRVAGGSTIGYSGNTGNSSGPHLHFGATNGPYAWLRRGGTVKYDNTPAVLHKGETVLTERLTRKFSDNVASGGGSDYNVTIDLRGAYIKEDVDIEKAVNIAIDKRESKVGRKRVVR